MSKSTYGARRAGLASLATLSLVTAAAVAGAGAASAVSDFKFDRIGGADRYETSTLVDDEFRDTGADVIIANGEPGNYADALAANTLAGEKNVPVLLTRKDKTPPSVLQQLKDDGVKNIWVVGGTSVVSDAQVAALTSAGYNVTRVAGADRFATNNEIIKMNGAATGGTGLIATGFNFPDALAAGPFSFQGHPLGLSTKDSIEDSTVQALKDAGVTKVLIFGGNTAVSPAVEAKLKANGIDTAARFAGTDRAETSTLAAEYALKNLGFTNTHVGVASGYVKGFGADALAGGPLEGKEKSPMLVTRDVNVPGASVLAYLKNHAATLKDGHLYGGTAAISAAAQAEMEKAAQTAPASATSLPELRSAAIVKTVTSNQADIDNPKGTTVTYTFDEAIASAGGLGPNAGQFKVYSSNGTPHTGATLVSVSGNTVTVRFGSIDVVADANALTVATVDDSAVRDLDGNFNPEGDAALGSSSGGGTVSLPAGTTVAPDLLSVSGFRATATPGQTAVDFTFDENATTTDAGGFHLVMLDNDDLTGVGPLSGTTNAGGTIAGGNGTKTITVLFDDGDGNPATRVTAADVARGTVAEGTVRETTNNETTGSTDENVEQAADVSNGGNTVGTPDLVSVELLQGAGGDADSAIYTFDEAVSSPDVLKFFAYDADAQPIAADDVETAAANGTDASTKIIVTFLDDEALDTAVGGYVLDDAVEDASTNGNQQDEVGVANTTTAGSQTPGRTAGPDLTGVALEQTKNVVGTVTGVKATYTFDEALTGAPNAVGSAADFHLYFADGTQATGPASCNVGPASGTTDDNTVVCTFNAPATDVGKAIAATLGTVDAGAVTDSTAIGNPEGAEFTTGGTGTNTN